MFAAHEQKYYTHTDGPACQPLSWFFRVSQILKMYLIPSDNKLIGREKRRREKLYRGCSLKLALHSQRIITFSINFYRNVTTWQRDLQKKVRWTIITLLAAFPSLVRTQSIATLCTAYGDPDVLCHRFKFNLSELPSRRMQRLISARSS